jgi:hypothetical protein
VGFGRGRVGQQVIDYTCSMEVNRMKVSGEDPKARSSWDLNVRLGINDDPALSQTRLVSHCSR